MTDAGYDPARLPPGQYLTEKWPVLHAGYVPRLRDLATWTLRVFGEVEQRARADVGAARRAAAHLEHAGHPLRHALVALRRAVRRRALARARQARAAEAERALRDRARRAGLHVERSARFLEDENALLATHADGEPLTPEHGYPLRLVIPGKYFWKSAKWLRGIELSSDDKPGFWERYGYNNNADPLKEERYEF